MVARPTNGWDLLYRTKGLVAVALDMAAADVDVDM